MEPHEAIVRRAIHGVSAGVVLLNLPLSLLRSLGNPGAYVAGFAPVVLLLLAVLTGWAIWWWARGLSAARPLRGIVVVSCVALLAHPWVEGPTPVPYPPLLHVMGAGMAISALVSVRASLFIIPAFATGVGLIRAPYLGVGAAVAEATLLALSGLVGTACVDVFQRASRSVQRTLTATWLLVEDSERAALRARERERWDGLVHDKVLGALRIASRTPGERVPPAARELAAAALAAFRGRPEEAVQPSVDCWRHHATHLGLAASFDVEGEVADPDVRNAVVGAVNEALTNVARHSGQGAVRVEGSLGTDRVRVAVVDRGRGFSPVRTAYGAGLRTSVVARMRSVGGTAEIHSAPGRGTRVEVIWDARDASEPAPDVEWQLRTFAPIMALGTLVLALNVIRGHTQWGQASSLVLPILGIIAILGVTAAATFLPPAPLNWVPLALVVLLTVAALALATPDGAPLDWRYWYLGALTPAIAAISYRFAPGVGVTTALIASALVALIDGAAGRSFWACLAGPVPVLLAVSVGGQLMRRGMDDAWRRVEDATRTDGELRLAIAVEEERSREATARTAALAGSVGPALELIASGPTVTREQARDLDLLESTTRDHLVAPGLVDADLARALEQARARGVRVDIVAVDDPGLESISGDGLRPEWYRAVLRVLLAQAESSTRVRVSWVSGDGRGRGTISAVGPGIATVVARVEAAVRALPGAVDVRVSHDEDSLLVEFAR